MLISGDVWDNLTHLKRWYIAILVIVTEVLIACALMMIAWIEFSDFPISEINKYAGLVHAMLCALLLPQGAILLCIYHRPELFTRSALLWGRVAIAFQTLYCCAILVLAGINSEHNKDLWWCIYHLRSAYLWIPIAVSNGMILLTRFRPEVTPDDVQSDLAALR